MTVTADTLRAGLSIALERTRLDGLGARYEGKVRDNYSRDDQRFLVVTDRISAFDRVLGTLPFKGQVLNQVAAWWFRHTEDVAPNHLLDVPDPCVMVARACEPLPVEMVVRGYLTGSSPTSVWTAYENGVREFCGHRLPEGMAKHQPFDTPLLTPSTKAPRGEHDQNISREEILATGKLSARDFDEAASYAMALFARGQKLCAERGLILVDTKYELGRTRDGKLVVIDEIHTPDSSRFWFASSYAERVAQGQEPESFDKEYVRRWLKAQGYQGDGAPPVIPDEVRIEAARRYIEACDTIRGEPFQPNLEPPEARIVTNLEARGYMP